ncbi:hypothetical protein [Herbaspirillum sp. SJZ107]|uniref:hypothetical protein n=1 Tax=Herbaspirillum sp. SJZ107 TaxID=2572881 RepID=UPI00114EB546|nr:hypothetical protein [Herbaspirillum sp. SJZ107]
MRTGLISQEELFGLRYLADEAEHLERKAKSYIQLMAGDFDGENSIGGLPKFKVTEEPSGRILGRLNSQFGEGRFILEFKAQDKTAKGYLVVEKHIFDKTDASTWVPVMHIPLPNPVWEVDGQPVRPNDKVYMLAASVLYAVINGTPEEQPVQNPLKAYPAGAI